MLRRTFDTGPKSLLTSMAFETTSLRVLIVDDERTIADMLAMIVRAGGHVAHVAYSGEEASAIADELKPHVTISDVMMPGMDGLELAAWLDEHHPECKVLLISAHPDGYLHRVSAARNGRPHRILSKPVYPSEILKFIASCGRASGQPLPGFIPSDTSTG